MSKPSTLWQRSRDGAWMTTANGRQVNLGKDKKKATEEFYKLMGGGKPQARCQLSNRRLCDTYLDRTRADKSDGRHQVQLSHLKMFCEKFGHRDPAGLKAHEVNDWLDSLAKKKGGPLSQSTKGAIVITVKAVMNWAVVEGYLTENPLAKLRRRAIARRDRVLTPRDRGRVLAEVSPYFRDFLSVLELTGCRPFSEAAKLTAALIDWDRSRAVLKEHKNQKKGRGRVIYFPPAVLATLRGLAGRHPSGPLLRNRLGNAWTKDNVGHYLDRVARELGIEPFVAYDYRHTFITEAIVKGVPVEAVAELVGTSAKMIHQHYAHLNKMDDALRAAALKAVS